MQYVRSRNTGFTLIEILVVLVIISIVTAVGLLSLGSLGGNPAAENAAQKLAAISDLVAQQAVMRGQQYGLRVSPHAYEFLSYDGNKWSPVSDDDLLRPRQVDSSVTLALELQGAEIKLPSTHKGEEDTLAPSDTSQAEIQPQILLLSSGEITPFKITVSGAGGKPVYLVTGDLQHSIHFEPPGNSDKH